MNNKKTFALVRAVVAVVLAVVLLACTGFAFVDMLAGADTVTQGTDLAAGDYVQSDLTYIMDVCGVERTAGGKEVAYYAVAPVGDQFAIVRFPASEFEQMTELEQDTLDFLQGVTSTMRFRIVVTGTVTEMDSSVAELLSQWFEDNASWMSQSGVITAVEDYSDYLCPVMIQASRVGAVSYNVALVLSILALALVVYAVVEAICLATGVYSTKPSKQKKAKPAKVPQTPEPTASDTIEITEEKHE